MCKVHAFVQRSDTLIIANATCSPRSSSTGESCNAIVSRTLLYGTWSCVLPKLHVAKSYIPAGFVTNALPALEVTVDIDSKAVP